jgi:hypothetical protein
MYFSREEGSKVGKVSRYEEEKNIRKVKKKTRKIFKRREFCFFPIN